MQTQTALPTTRTTQIAYPPIAAVTLAIAALWTDLFRILFPAIARACGSRLDRATALLQREDAIVQVDIHLYQVASEWGPGTYLVDVNRKSCTCPDATVNHSPTCKHRLAVHLAVNGPNWLAAAQQTREHALALARCNLAAAQTWLDQCDELLECEAGTDGIDQALAESQLVDATAEVARLERVLASIDNQLISKWATLPPPAVRADGIRPNVHPDDITRIDMTIVGDGTLTVRKYPAGWTASTPPVECSITPKPLDECLTWLESHGWTIRRWPGGARAWQGEILPVRNRDSIKRLREQFQRHPVPGVQAHTLELAYDW